MAGGLSAPAPAELLTADDIVRAGACTSGVARRLSRIVDRRPGEVAAAESPARLLTLVPEEEHQYIEAAISDIELRRTGSCPSDGDGYGDGYGDGDGDGDGYGGLSGGSYA